MSAKRKAHPSSCHHRKWDSGSVRVCRVQSTLLEILRDLSLKTEDILLKLGLQLQLLRVKQLRRTPIFESLECNCMFPKLKREKYHMLQCVVVECFYYSSYYEQSNCHLPRRRGLGAGEEGGSRTWGSYFCLVLRHPSYFPDATTNPPTPPPGATERPQPSCCIFLPPQCVGNIFFYLPVSAIFVNIRVQLRHKLQVAE